MGVTTYNALLDCIFKLCEEKDPFRLFPKATKILVEMEAAGVPRNESTLNTLISHLCKICKTKDNSNFQWRIYLRSRLGEETCGSGFLFNDETVTTFEEAWVEIEESFVVVLDELFAKTCVESQEIDIVIVKVSTFILAPSLAAWIMDRYKMKDIVKTSNFSDMGCSANIIVVDMAKDLFKIHRNSYAMLVGSENITLNANYESNDRSMMVTNCLFRVSGNAVLLSNNAKDAARAKMKLLHVVKTNVAANEAYGYIMAKEDGECFYGIGLRTTLIDVTRGAVRKNIATLGPKVLPIMELLYYAKDAYSYVVCPYATHTHCPYIIGPYATQ